MMTELDERIRRNLDRLTEGGASDTEIRTYLEHEGFTLDDAPAEPGVFDQEGILGTAGPVGQTMSGVNEGLAALIGTPVSAGNALMDLALDATGNPFGWDASDRPIGGINWMRGVMSPTITDEAPSSGLERVLRRGGQEVGAAALPAGAMLGAARRAGQTASPLMQAMGFNQARATPGRYLGEEAAAATAGGLAAGAAMEASDNPLVEFAAQLAGGAAPSYAVSAGRFAGDIWRQGVPDVTTSAQRRAVADVLREQASDPGALVPSLNEGLATPEIPGLRPSTAEMAGDIGLLRFQRGLSTGSDIRLPAGSADGFAQIRRDNRDAFRSFLEATSPEAVEAARVTSGIQDATERLRASTRRIWSQVDPDNVAPVSQDQIRVVVNDMLSRLSPRDRRQVPADVLGAADDFPDGASFLDLQDLRRDLGVRIRTAERGVEPNPNLVRILSGFDGAIGRLMDDAAADSPDPDLMNRYTRARDSTREMYSIVGTPAYRNFEQVVESPDQAITRLLASQNPVADMRGMSRLLEADPEAMEGLRRAFFDQLLFRMGVRESRPIAAEGIASRLDAARNNPRVRLLMSELLSPEQMDNLERMRQWSIVLGRSTQDEVRGSPTAQRLSAQQDALSATRTLAAILAPARTRTAAVLAGSPIGGMIQKIGQEGRERLLLDAMVDPTVARDLLTEVTPRTQDQLSRRLHAHLVSVGLAPAEESLEQWLEDQE